MTIWFSPLRLFRPHGLLELHRKVLGESLARGSPLSSSRFAALAPFYTRRAQWAFSVIGGITRPVTRSLLLGLLVNLAPRPTLQIGRASCRERVVQYVVFLGGYVSFKKK